MRMKELVFLAALVIGMGLPLRHARAGDLSLDGSLATGTYATENGGVIAQGACVIDSGVHAVFIGDRFTFKAGFHVKAGGTLRTLFADYDSLPDAWEVEHFGGLEQRPGDDPDGDELTNLQEYQAGVDPNLYQTDADNDGLPDIWEVTWFANLNQGPSDDPDGDGMTNIVEYRMGANPTIPIENDSSCPGPGIHYQYDALGRVVSVRKFTDDSFIYGADYGYDEKGNRVSVTVEVGN